MKLSVGVSGYRPHPGDNTFMERNALTPGKLYARLSAEFRRLRPEHCVNCRMPMVVLTRRAGPDACNWAVEATTHLCDNCKGLIEAIVARAAEEFDLYDPTSARFFPHPPPAGDSRGALRT